MIYISSHIIVLCVIVNSNNNNNTMSFSLLWALQHPDEMPWKLLWMKHKLVCGENGDVTKICHLAFSIS